MNRVAPAFTLPSGLDTRAIARDPEAARAYAEDRLNHDKITARWFADCYAAGLWALERAAEFPLPLLLMHGGADQITSSGATRVFASRVRGDCTLKIWDGLYHETHNEPEQREVIAFIRDWLRAHMP